MSLTRDLARLNIDSAGTINIGTTSSFSVNNTSDGTAIDAKKNGTSQATIGVSGSAGTLVLNTNGSSGVGLFGSTNNGGCLLPTDGAAGAVDNARDLGRADVRWRDIYLPGGAYLGGTTTDNKLDDYEEGSWTPVLQSGSTTRAITNAVGRYTKIGREVTVVGSFTRNTATSDAGHLRISGLPFSRFTATYLVPLGSGWMWVDNGTGNDILGFIYMSDAQSVLGVVDHDVRGGRYIPYNDIVNGRPVYFRIDYTAV